MAGAAHSEVYIAFCKRLVEIRKSKGLSQAQLALKLGKPASFVGKYELGERRLDVVEAWVILQALDANPSSILTEVLSEVPSSFV